MIEHPRKHDLTGVRFGRLVALHPAKAGKRAGWKCVCDCGSHHTVDTYCLRSGRTTSCGCKLLDGSIRRTHGMKGTRVYNIWKDMRKRCNNPNTKFYKNYGGRGIKVCNSWNSFSVFLSDMGCPPTEKHQIDRIDPDGNYCKDNCRWVTAKEQQRNRRNNTRITFMGKTLCLAEWEEETGIDQRVISRRISLGWSPKVALTTPIYGREA